MGIFSRTKKFDLATEMVNGIVATIPRPAFPHAVAEKRRFPLGVAGSTNAVWDTTQRPNLFAVGAGKLGRSTLVRTLAAHGYEFADSWEIRIIHSAKAADNAARTIEYQSEYAARVESYTDNQDFSRKVMALRRLVADRSAHMHTPGSSPLFPILVIIDDLDLFIHPDFSREGYESVEVAHQLYELIPNANAVNIHFAILNKGAALDRIVGSDLAASFMPVSLSSTNERDSLMLFKDYIAARVPSRNYFRERDKSLPPLLGRGVTLLPSGEPAETQFYKTMAEEEVWV
ncbi:hypothetical protein [Rarobacter incanus]|uniref:FtsK/SpoIIIE family protein n=1 Tax=Rarobacter incanus TaxID=153494 RepID=A0A542SNK2_9MICO|nr:hypothetical protein [Rarobacter incanus]TQK76148.1 hypothetical protein FB389_0806 [Rarobacter incanus]